MKPISFLYTNIDINLCSDMEEIARNILIAKQYKNDEVEALQNPLKTLIEHKIASIPVQKWEVIFSKEFRCPKGYETALKKLTRKIEIGEDINPFLSTRRNKTDMKDSLLYDWGIYHLHLTNRYNKNGYPKRSDYLLFVFCDKEKMYFIQVYPHHPNPFAKEELLRIIAYNWPALISRFCLDNGHLTETITDEGRALLRKNGVLSAVEFDDKIYFPLGGGYASDGSSILAVREADDFWNQMKLLERWILQNQSFMRREMLEFISESDFSEMLHFKLWKFSHKKISVFEIKNCVLMEYDLSEQVCKFIFLGMVPDIHFDNMYGRQAFPYWAEQAIGGYTI